MQTLKINAKFQSVLKAMEEGDHLFITGKAGTGKSTLLSHFCQTLVKNRQKPPPLLAPTGVAALNIEGRTIHSFFSFSSQVTPNQIKEQPVAHKEVFRHLQRIIIDEASMLRADLLDCIDVFLRLYGPAGASAVASDLPPFGGVQMIFFGDLYQLPPVVSRAEMSDFRERYASPYFFSAHVFAHPFFQKKRLRIIELDQVYRQRNQTFVSLLNRIRVNQATEADLQLLVDRTKPNFSPRQSSAQSRSASSHSPSPPTSPPNKAKNENSPETSRYIYLTTTNQMANEINEGRLKALPGRKIEKEAKIDGIFGQEDFPTNRKLILKPGAQVMFLINDPKKRWVNGTLGSLEKIDEKNERLLVYSHESEKMLIVEPFRWEKFAYQDSDEEIPAEPTGSFCQYPVRLAWALTIHKSQGKTFERAIIDIGRGVFAPGQVYVALSRVSSLKGLVLKKRISRRHILVDSQITRFFADNPPE